MFKRNFSNWKVKQYRVIEQRDLIHFAGNDDRSSHLISKIGI